MALQPLARHGYTEDTGGVDFRLDLVETGLAHQRVHLGLAPAAHDPGIAAAVAGQDPADQLLLRMPGLIRIDQIASGLYGTSQTRQ